MNQDLVYKLWAECVAKHSKCPMNWQAVADEFAQLCWQEGYDSGYEAAILKERG
jgi:hypothetical protein